MSLVQAVLLESYCWDQALLRNLILEPVLRLPPALAEL